MSKLRPLMIALFGLVLAGATPAADPVVTNVTASQRTDGSMLVDVTYDLADAEGDICEITINASGDDGQTWHLPCLTYSGDVGDGVTPGTGKSAVWDLGHDNAGWSGETFRIQVIASDYGFSHQAHSPQTYANHHWGSSRWNEPSFVERISRSDLLSITTFLFWDNGPGEARQIVGEIKSHNPDCKVIGYVMVQGVPHEFAQHAPGSFGRLLYDATLPYWSYTTTGDTLSSWPNVVELNILDPNCRETIISTYVDYHDQTSTKFDGLFWDYFPDQVWIPDFVGCEGYADMDQDGIPQPDDPDEIAAYHAAQEDLVYRMRAAMGDDFILIFNGVRAQRDSVFAALSDGINYEIFPTLRFNAPKIASALDVDLSYSLWHSSTWPRTTAGGPYVLLENVWRYNYYDHLGQVVKYDPGDAFRVIGLLIDGIYPVWDSVYEHWWDWPDVLVSLGAPLGPAVIDGDVYTREYTYGDVWMEMGSGEWPNPFDYRITVNGNIVEELDIPYHFP